MNTETLKDTKDSPGVYVPPPLIYVGVFITAILLQKVLPISDVIFKEKRITIVGFIFIIIALFFLVRSLRQFLTTRNTLITIRPASSLQTNGIYRLTRNPMYFGLANVYLAVTCFIGNWWNIILLPLLIIVVQEYVIKREEQYLTRKFGQVYLDYKGKVRRWI